LRPPATEKAQLLARFGHTVINALGNSAETRKEGYRLQRALADQFSKALVEMGLTQEQAEIEARACGRSPSVWRVWNLLQRADLCSEIPDWARAEHADKVVPAVLLGGWSESYEGDKEVITAITGLDFNINRDELHPFLSQDHPLLTKVGDAWVVTAPATAFALIVRHITRSHIERLSKIIPMVFEETDPAIDFPPDERPYAALRAGGMRHSTWIRDGLAETLLRIVVIGARLEETGAIPANQGRQAFVDQLIRQLRGLSEDWRLLASLRDQLPVLAEAAPNPFLEALERLLQGPPEKILPIFEEGDSTFGHAYHPALWWALETLAWEPLYLARVGLILARLAKLDPGGVLNNRPIHSLREIFLAWHPSTSANLDQRLQVLDLILEREPEVGWTLLLALMPKSNDHALPTSEPIWKDFSRSQRKTLTHGMVRQAYEEYIDRAITHGGGDPSRCRQLIQFYTEVSELHRTAIEDHLKALAATDLTDDDRNSTWDSLRDFIISHRQFADASWALPANKLDRLEEIRDLFAPVDPVDRWAWLFNELFPDIPLSSRDFSALDSERQRLRAKGLEEIWQAGGIGSLMSLLDQVLYPGLVGAPLLDVLPSEAEILNVFENAVQDPTKQRPFASLLSRAAYYRFGDRWTRTILSLAAEKNWPPEAIVNAFVEYPDSRETFELVNALGPEVEREYWQSKQWIHPTEDTETTLMVIEKLMAAGRALDVVALSPNNLAMLGSREILNVLDQALKELSEGKTSRTTGSPQYWIEELFDWLRGRSDVDRRELARREYACLPLLTQSREKKGLALHELLSTDVGFFVDVICDLYKPASSNQETDTVSEERRVRAKFAWELLRSWSDPPGLDEGRQVNSEELREWVTRARLLASERDRKKVADQHIGNVFYYYPQVPADTAWPHTELRRLIEELQSDDIEKGIEIEQFNSRGVVWYGPFEGGNQERTIAERWRNWANIVGLRWPRTRQMLERIAASWDRLAVERDQDAEKERLRSS